LPTEFPVRIEPGGHVIRVAPGENVLAAALAAGLPLPHSCRAGRCASCKAQLLSGEIAYPDDRLPPGITATEAARGEVLLCQARARTPLVVRARSVGTSVLTGIAAQVLAIEPLPGNALRVRLRLLASFAARPGQFLDVANGAGNSERLAVIGTRAGEIDLEAGDDGSALRLWLEADAVPGSGLTLTGPFDRPR
jgi:CDP-4-dehydro-6-deoxyglucose reductase, E3